MVNNQDVIESINRSVESINEFMDNKIVGDLKIIGRKLKDSIDTADLEYDKLQAIANNLMSLEAGKGKLIANERLLESLELMGVNIRLEYNHPIVKQISINEVKMEIQFPTVIVEYVKELGRR